MNRNIKLIFGLLFVLLIVNPFSVEAKTSAKKQKTRVNFLTTKLSDGTRYLEAKIFTKKGPVFTYLHDEPVTFSALTDTSSVVLGEISTNKDGIASLYIDKDYKIPTDTNGRIVLVFSYDGNDSCKAKEEELEIHELYIKTEFSIDEDSFRFVNVKLEDFKGNPVEDQEVSISVKRLYSYLPIGSDMTDEDGMISVEFPSDLPGDSIGMLQVRAKVTESMLYGTVENNTDIQWGTKVDFSEVKVGRKLWSNDAPLWMIIAIYIVLLGAWVNFVIAMVNVYKMKKNK